MNIVDEIIEYAHSCIYDNDKAISYLHGRGVSDNQINSHRIGFIPGSFECDKKLHGSECSHYMKWSANGKLIKNNLILPIYAYDGTAYGFVSRSLDKKDYNTFIIKNRPLAYFFGIDQAIDHIWMKKQIILTEGPFDQLVLERFFGTNVVSILTSSITKNHVLFVSRFVDSVVFCLDNDDAGIDGLVRSVAKIREVRYDIDIRYIEFSGSKDVNELWQKYGDSFLSRLRMRY